MNATSPAILVGLVAMVLTILVVSAFYEWWTRPDENVTDPAWRRFVAEMRSPSPWRRSPLPLPGGLMLCARPSAGPPRGCLLSHHPGGRRSISDERRW